MKIRDAEVATAIMQARPNASPVDLESAPIPAQLQPDCKPKRPSDYERREGRM
jgi:hypothetical protein